MIASITFINVIGTCSYNAPRAPHIEIVRSNQATLVIKNVRTEDEGTYKIEYSVELGGTPIADHRVNVTVLGNLLHVKSLFEVLSLFLRFWLLLLVMLL